MFIQYKEVSKATRPAFAQYRADSLLDLWIVDTSCCVWEVPCTFRVFIIAASIKGKKLKCMSSLRNTFKGYLQQIYKIVLIKTLPGILSFNTFFSGIPKCCTCFTRSLFTKAIQAHTAPSFVPLFLTKYILHIPHLFPVNCFPSSTFVS